MTRLLTIPFVGNKRHRLRELIEFVENSDYEKVVEPFGGSCMISVNLHRQTGVECIANDYDRLFDNYDELLDYKDEIMERVQAKGITKQKDNRLSRDQQKVLSNLMKDYPPEVRKFVAGNFMFSAKVSQYDGESLKGFAYFQNDITTDKGREYLEEIEKIQLDTLDYKDFIQKYVKPNSNTLVILDPPYLNSEQKSYNNEKFFGLRETIELLQIMQGLNVDFIFFNQIKEDIQALLELFNIDFELSVQPRHIGGGIYREDVMAICKS